MTRENFVAQMDQQVKLVRTEYGFTQDVMAQVFVPLGVEEILRRLADKKWGG